MALCLVQDINSNLLDATNAYKPGHTQQQNGLGWDAAMVTHVSDKINLFDLMA